MPMLASRRRPQPNLSQAWAVSLGLHAGMLVFLSMAVHRTLIIPPAAPMQVRIVGIPQPAAASNPMVQPEKIRTQDSPAPKEPPPDMKNIPPSEAKTKFLQKVEPPKPDKPNPMEAKERPPVLDKNPEKKKVVKNDKDAKVVKNPEDFMKALDFVDKLSKTPTPKPAVAKATPDKTAGEGPEIQLNLAEQGIVDAIRRHIEQNWLKPPGAITKNLETVVEVNVDSAGNVLKAQVTGRSGNSAYDNSILRAIRRSSPLPVPTQDFEKFSVLELHFQG